MFNDKIKNPICDGQDPYILLYEGMYYQYLQSKDDSGYDVLVSKDLQEWENAGRCFYKDDCIGEKDFWAPEVVYSKGRFFMAYTADLHLGIAVADHPCGPFRQKEKKWVFEKNAIDGHLFIDGEKIYLYNVFWGHKNNLCREEIWGCELDADFNPIMSTLTQLIVPETDWETVEGNVVEGPFVLKHKNKYYMTYSANNYQCRNYAIGYAVSNAPLGRFIKCGGNPVMKSCDKFISPGHNSFVKSNRDDSLLCVFHIHGSLTEVLPRKVCVSKSKFIAKENGDDVLYIENPM